MTDEMKKVASDMRNDNDKAESVFATGKRVLHDNSSMVMSAIEAVTLSALNGTFEKDKSGGYDNLPPGAKRALMKVARVDHAFYVRETDDLRDAERAHTAKRLADVAKEENRLLKERVDKIVEHHATERVETLSELNKELEARTSTGKKNQLLAEQIKHRTIGCGFKAEMYGLEKLSLFSGVKVDEEYEGLLGQMKTMLAAEKKAKALFKIPDDPPIPCGFSNIPTLGIPTAKRLEHDSKAKEATAALVEKSDDQEYVALIVKYKDQYFHDKWKPEDDCPKYTAESRKILDIRWDKKRRVWVAHTVKAGPDGVLREDVKAKGVPYGLTKAELPEMDAMVELFKVVHEKNNLKEEKKRAKAAARGAK